MPDRRSSLKDQLLTIPLMSHALASTVLRDGLVDGPELLALVASRGREDLAELVATADAWLATGEEEVPPDVAEGYRPRAVGALASVMLGRDASDTVRAASARVFRFAWGLGPLDQQAETFPRLAVQTQLATGDVTAARTMLAHPAVDGTTAWMARTDLLARDVGVESPAWLASFNEPFLASGVAPVRLDDAGRTPFERLAATGPPCEHVGPVAGEPALVSVVMAVHRPGEGFGAAVRSVLAQTHRDLEVIVVDDGSPAEYAEILDRVETWDPRITMLRMPTNGGAYRVRNAGLRVARGRFVTFHDSDDWSHPERIEHQVARLLGHPDELGVVGRSVRATADLGLTTVGAPSIRENVSSLLFRRAEVMERLGGYDPVRKAADSEFADRVAATFGPDAVAGIPQVLMVVQLTPSSLSRDEVGHGWVAEFRQVYRDSFTHWHEQVRAGAASPAFAEDGPRPFPAPPALLGRADERQECDVLHVADWRESADGSAASLDATRALVASGLVVHVAQVDDLHFASRGRRPIRRELQEMCATGVVGRATWGEVRSARLVVVDRPELLAFRWSAGRLPIETPRLLVRADVAPRAGSRGGLLHDPATVEDHARQLFGIEMEWVVASDDVASALAADGAVAPMHPLHGAGPARRRGLLRRANGLPADDGAGPAAWARTVSAFV